MNRWLLPGIFVGILFSSAGSLQGQILDRISISGTLQPSVMIRKSNGDIINLPERVADLRISFSNGPFDFISSHAAELRWNDVKPEYELRELYAVWYPNFGEVKAGKQILAWGAADGNNPTDNLNPYNYYYMFLPGTDRKDGVLSLSANFVFDRFQTELVYLPEHNIDIIPYNEPDFPIVPFDKPPAALISEPTQPGEYGLRVKTMIGENDLSLSWFQGHDRSFTNSGFKTIGWEMYVPSFGYRKTRMLGADLVGFVGDMTYRMESAWFSTRDEDWLLKSRAEYWQSVLQIEFPGPMSTSWMVQYIGSGVQSFEGYGLEGDGPAPPHVGSRLDESMFNPGMGTPFAIFTDSGLMGGIKGSAMDERLEGNLTLFYDLKEYGLMVGIGGSWSPMESLKGEFSMVQFIPPDNKPQNPFNLLKDFSHVSLGLSYSY